MKEGCQLLKVFRLYIRVVTHQIGIYCLTRHSFHSLTCGSTFLQVVAVRPPAWPHRPQRCFSPRVVRRMRAPSVISLQSRLTRNSGESLSTFSLHPFNGTKVWRSREVMALMTSLALLLAPRTCHRRGHEAVQHDATLTY